MANDKSDSDLMKQAVIKAKEIREAAIINARETLAETLTPRLSALLAQKLQEWEEEEVTEEKESEEEVTEEKDNSETVTEETEDDSEESDDKESEEAEEEESEEETEEEPSEIPTEEPQEGPSDEDDVSSLTVADLKDIIRDQIAALMPNDPAAVEDPIPGDEEIPVDVVGTEMEPEMEPETEDDDEIDLEEILKEIESVSKGETSIEEEEANEISASVDPEVVATVLTALTALGVGSMINPDELKAKIAQGKEALAGYISSLRGKKGPEEGSMEELTKELNEVNLLNAKLLYLNKILQKYSLSENQKAETIVAFDHAENVKEVKLVYETLLVNLGNTKKVVGESVKSKGFASNPIKSTKKELNESTKKPSSSMINEETRRRLQELSGIIKR